jgi:hypothetical protein
LKKSSAEHDYILLSLPMYLAGQLGRVLENVLDGSGSLDIEMGRTRPDLL